MENQNNIKNEENNTNSNNNQSQGFLDNILSKDNNQNKLFLKSIFGLSAAILAGILWLAFKGLMFYMQIKKVEKASSSSDLMGGLGALGDAGTSILNILQTISNVHNIFKFGTILLIIVLVLSYLKMKKENLTSNFTKINYLSAVGVALIGILEIIKVDKYMNIVKNPLAAGMSMMSNQQEIPNPNPKLWIFFSVLFLILAVISTTTNYFKAFKSKDFEMADVQAGIQTAKEKYNKMDSGQKKKIGIIAAVIVGALVLYNIGVNYIFLDNVDFSKAYAVRVTGDSENASISWETKYDYYYKMKEEANNNNKKAQKEMEFLDNGEISIDYPKNKQFKNGDTVTVNFTYNKDLAKKLKIRPKNTKVKIKIENLPKIAKEVNEVKNLKAFITKLSQARLEHTYDNMAFYNVVDLSTYSALPNIYYKKDDSGHLTLKYFYGSVSAGEEILAVTVKNIILDKNGNIISYDDNDLNDKNNYEKYYSIPEIEAAMNSEGYMLLN